VTQPRRPCWNLSTRRIKLVVAYDGTDFCGWAPQRGLRTVHGTLTEAIRQVSGEDIEITGASRTDSGAHALGQAVHFDQEGTMPAGNWVRALGDRLPPDVAAVHATGVPGSFHARFSARSRTYRYRIATGPRDPFRDRTAWWHGRPLDCEAMREAAKALVGSHDFRAFSQDLPPETNFVRHVEAVEVSEARRWVDVTVTASAFLRGMMRRIAGALWQVGRGHWPGERAGELLGPLAGEVDAWPPVAPAHGLTLMRVHYGRWPRDWRSDEPRKDDLYNQQGTEDE
jgi:tRNA pseudouridine38-40 synthase